MNIKGQSNIIRINGRITNCKIDGESNQIIIAPIGSLTSLTILGNNNIVQNNSNAQINLIDNGIRNQHYFQNQLINNMNNISDVNNINNMNNMNNMNNINGNNPPVNNNLNGPFNNNYNNPMQSTGQNINNSIYYNPGNYNGMNNTGLLNRNISNDFGRMTMGPGFNNRYNPINNNLNNYQNNLNPPMANPPLNLGMSMTMPMAPYMAMPPPQNNYLNQSGILNPPPLYPMNQNPMPPNMNMYNTMNNWNMNNYPYAPPPIIPPMFPPLINNSHFGNPNNIQRENTNQINNNNNNNTNYSNKKQKNIDEKTKLKIQLIKEFDEFQYKNKDKFNESFIEEECSICLGKYRATDKIKVLPCKHIYHKKCIKEWLCHHDNCPLCNFDISKEVTKMKSELEKHIYEEEHPEEEN